MSDYNRIREIRLTEQLIWNELIRTRGLVSFTVFFCKNEQKTPKCSNNNGQGKFG